MAGRRRPGSVSPEEQVYRDHLAMALLSRRADLGLSQHAVALRGGFDRSFYAEVERGARDLTVSMLHRYAAALDTTADRLLRPAEEPSA